MRHFLLALGLIVTLFAVVPFTHYTPSVQASAAKKRNLDCSWQQYYDPAVNYRMTDNRRITMSGQGCIAYDEPPGYCHAHQNCWQVSADTQESISVRHTIAGAIGQDRCGTNGWNLEMQDAANNPNANYASIGPLGGTFLTCDSSHDYRLIAGHYFTYGSSSHAYGYSACDSGSRTAGRSC